MPAKSKVIFCMLALTLLSTPAFPIGKTGNNTLYDTRDRLSVNVPADYPSITEYRDGSVILRSIQILPGYFDAASFQIFSFRDRYQKLVSSSLEEVKIFFTQANGMSYQVLSESSNKLVLVGQNNSTVVGIVVAPGGRGLVLVGQSYEIIKQGILDTMNGTVFQ